MDYVRGAHKALRKAHLRPDYVSLVIDRLEAAVPHLHFEPWRVKRHRPPKDAPIGEVKWRSGLRTEVEVALDLDRVRLWTLCTRDSGVLPISDYEFLLGLSDEAAKVVTASRATSISLFDFGMAAVADEIERRARLGIEPLAILRFVRSLSQETYENQRLSYGLIFSRKRQGIDPFAAAMDNKRLKRLTDGFSTALILDSNGNIAGYASYAAPKDEGTRATRRPWWIAGLADASKRLDGVGIALLRSGDMMIVHKGRVLFSQRAGKWRIWNHPAILTRLRDSWFGRGKPSNLSTVLTYLYHVALDLSFRRSGGLLVVVNDKTKIGRLLMSKSDRVHSNSRDAAEQALDDLVSTRKIQRIDRRIIADLASLDGALVVDRTGTVFAYGAMTRSAGGATQGARTRAAIASSRQGIAIKVSSDGNITFFAHGRPVMDL